MYVNDALIKPPYDEAWRNPTTNPKRMHNKAGFKTGPGAETELLVAF